MSDVPYHLHDKPFDQLDPYELYGILALRSQVFVVEQNCVFLDPDGRDIVPTARHIWIERDRRVVSACRLIDEGLHREIGRIVTLDTARGDGLASKLIDHCLAASDGPWQLNAQAHLADWYGQLGFHTVGDEYLEDGIPHVEMVHE